MRGSYDDDIYLDDHYSDLNLQSANRDEVKISSDSANVQNGVTPKAAQPDSASYSSVPEDKGLSVDRAMSQIVNSEVAAIDTAKNVSDGALLSETSSNVEMEAALKRASIRERTESVPGDLGSHFSVRDKKLDEKRSATDEPNQPTENSRLASVTKSTENNPAEKQQLATLQKGQRIVLKPRTGAIVTQRDLLAQYHLPENETPNFRVELPDGISEIVYQHGVFGEDMKLEPGRDFVEALRDAGPILMAECPRQV